MGTHISLMKRKIIRQGTNTLTISLPAHWTRTARVGPGDAVEVSEDGDMLVVTPQGATTGTSSSTVTLTGLRRGMVFILLTGAYTRGDDEVRVTYDGPRQLDDILNAVQDLIGFEVVEHAKNTCIIRDLTAGAPADIDALLRRVFLLIVGLAEDGIDALRSNSAETIHALVNRDAQINKFTYYCLRSINKHRASKTQQATRYASLLTLLEHLGDEYGRIFCHWDGALRKQTIDAYRDAVDMTRELYELFYKYDPKRIVALLDHRNAVRGKFTTMTSGKHSDVLALFRIQKIADLIGDIAKIVPALHQSRKE